MSELLPWFGTAVVWAALAYQLLVIRKRGGDPVPRWLAVALASLAAALTLNLPDVYLAFDRLVGEPNLGELVVHGTVLVAGWAAQGAILHFLHQRPGATTRILRRAAVLITALCAMAIFFFLAPLDMETTEFTTAYAAAPYVAEYWLSYLAFLGFALVDVLRMNWRYSRRAGGILGASLRLLALGAACGLVYVTHKTSYVALNRWSDVSLSSEWHTTISHTAMATCVVLTAVGSTLPRWGPALGRAWRRIEHLRTYRRLGSLWDALDAACSDRVLLRSRGGRLDSWNPRNIEFRLYRRIIEIRDGQLELSAFVDDQTSSTAESLAAAAGLRGRAFNAAVEAMTLRAALAARASDRRAQGGGRRMGRANPPDLAEEAQWLLDVARFFDQPPAGNPVHEESHA